MVVYLAFIGALRSFSFSIGSCAICQNDYYSGTEGVPFLLLIS